jgi:hypothetical protein
VPGRDLAAEGAQACREHVRDRLRAAARKRPARRVRECEQHQSGASAAAAVERQDRVCGSPEEERPGVVVVEPGRDLPGTARSDGAEAGQLPRMWCQAPDRSEQARRDIERGRDQLPVRRPELVGRTPDEQRGAVVERMREGRRRLDQVEVQSERAEEGRGGRERVDRGADVVAEPGQRQLRGARSAADRVPRLEHEHGASRLGKSDRGGQPVRAGADDDGV